MAWVACAGVLLSAANQPMSAGSAHSLAGAQRIPPVPGLKAVYLCTLKVVQLSDAAHRVLAHLYSMLVSSSIKKVDDNCAVKVPCIGRDSCGAVLAHARCESVPCP
jgi:hypothetical protein